jgi:hypothetical protein
MSYQHLWDTLVEYYNRSIAFDAPRPNDSPDTRQLKQHAQDSTYALVWLIEQIRHSPLFDGIVPSQSQGLLTLQPNDSNIMIYVRSALPDFVIEAEYTADQSPITQQQVSTDEIISSLEELVQWATSGS